NFDELCFPIHFKLFFECPNPKLRLLMTLGNSFLNA
ncbi:MAG: hypothetical protein ACI9JY_003246, partial [Saprospiraceae bacterium]